MTNPMPLRKTKLAFAWLVLVTFISASVVANFQHGTNPTSQYLLAMPPVAFAATVALLEMMGSRITWPARLALGMVATAAGVASYIGLYGLAHGKGHIGAVPSALIPLALDGVVIAASMTIRSLGHVQGKRVDIKGALDKLGDMTERVMDIPVPDTKPVDIKPDMSNPALDTRGHVQAPDVQPALDMSPRVQDTSDVHEDIVLTETTRSVQVSRRGKLSPQDKEAILARINEALDVNGPVSRGDITLGQLDAALAEEHAVSSKTVKRLRADAGLVQVSAPPALTSDAR